jgi:hypothetical protein
MSTNCMVPCVCGAFVAVRARAKVGIRKFAMLQGRERELEAVEGICKVGSKEGPMHQYVDARTTANEEKVEKQKATMRERDEKRRQELTAKDDKIKSDFVCCITCGLICLLHYLRTHSMVPRVPISAATSPRQPKRRAMSE